MAVAVETGEERWQRKTKSLRGGIEHIFETKEFADVQFLVGARTFKAHRLILAARSPEFVRLLTNPPRDASLTTKEIISDVSEDGFDILLRYIYTNKLDDLERTTLLEAHQAASKFRQPGLLRLCEDRIAKWDITYDNVCALLNQLSGIESMKQRCLQFLRDNAQSVLTSEGLAQASSRTLSLMFEGGYFKHASPLIRLDSAIHWAQEQLPEEKKNDYAICRELLIKNILGRCGIDQLSNADLAKIIAKYSNLLTPTECAAFFMNANSPGAMPLPFWCKTNE